MSGKPWISGVALAAGVFALAAATPSAEARTTVAVASPWVGPVISGSNLVYGVAIDDGGLEPSLALFARSPGRPAAELTTISPDGGYDNLEPFGLEASATRATVAAWTGGNQYGYFSQSLFSGPAGRSRHDWRILSTGGTGACAIPTSVDVHRESVAYIETTHSSESYCTNHRTQVFIQSRNRPARLLATSRDSLSNVRLAGRYASWLVPAEAAVVVYDHVRGAEVYRIGEDRNGRVLGHDLQPDGKIAATFSRDPARPPRLAWFSPSKPFAHPIDGVPTSAPLIARDQIAFMREARKGSELAVASLSGAARRVVSFEPPRLPVGRFDFDGRSVAFGRRECVGPALSLEIVEHRLHRSLPQGCPIRVPRRKLTVSSTGEVAVPFVCSHGCRGSIELSDAAPRATSHFRVEGRSTKRFVLESRRLRELQARASIRARLSIRVASIDGSPAAERHARVLLRASRPAVRK